VILIPWLVRSPRPGHPSRPDLMTPPDPTTPPDRMTQPDRRERLRLVAVCAGTAALVASPQVIAMIWQAASGGASTPPYAMYHDYSGSGAGLVQMFAPSPRLAAYGMSSLAALYYHGRGGWVVIGYGLVVSVAAL